jgi:GMP synthase PP-ATPase subunit
MHKVFISGSMGIKKLDENVQSRINNIVDSGYQVIVGDASGVDSSIQEYLISKNMKSVLVYCSGENPRNNLGSWPTKKIKTDSPPGTRAFFTAKDLKMAEDCDYGFMVWDTKSTGTLSNAIELLKRHKMALVYVNKTKEFLKVKEVSDLEKLVSYMSKTMFDKADKKLNINAKIQSFKNQQSSLF